jgi:hypothetical protein
MAKKKSTAKRRPQRERMVRFSDASSSVYRADESIYIPLDTIMAMPVKFDDGADRKQWVLRSRLGRRRYEHSFFQLALLDHWKTMARRKQEEGIAFVRGLLGGLVRSDTWIRNRVVRPIKRTMPPFKSE